MIISPLDVGYCLECSQSGELTKGDKKIWIGNTSMSLCEKHVKTLQDCIESAYPRD